MLCHFPDRLFDRDTLWLNHYDVNLLYIMSLYSRDDSSEQHTFKTTFRNTVQNNFKEMLSHTYEFFWVIPTGPVEEFVEKYFYKLNGRVYIPHFEEKRLLMALEWKVPKEESSEECIKM